jgi:hypothetical protein
MVSGSFVNAQVPLPTTIVATPPALAPEFIKADAMTKVTTEKALVTSRGAHVECTLSSSAMSVAIASVYCPCDAACATQGACTDPVADGADLDYEVRAESGV